MSNNSITIANTLIRQDAHGRYCLNDLQKAAGNHDKHKPANFLRLESAQALINEINQFSNMRTAVEVINGGNNRGTYVVKELVYAYAMWISPSFHLQVIRAYDALVTQAKQPQPQQTELFSADSDKLHTLQSEHSQLQDKYIGLLEDKVAWLEQLTQATPKRAKKSNVSETEVLQILRLHAQGLSNTAIAKQIGRSSATVSFIVRGAKGGAA